MVISMNYYNKFQNLKPSHKVGVVLATLLVLYFIVHHFNKSGPPPIPVPMVGVQNPVLTEVVEYVTQTGTTVALNSVDLVARIEGYLDKINFVDGTNVKKGQLLFVIQPEPYWEQLKAAQATVAAQTAVQVYNNSEYARQKRMYKDNATSLNDVEKWLAKTQEIAAEIDKAKANEVNAQINYSYTHVLAPFDGRMGRHLVDVGNLVGNGKATDLATIQQINTLYVYFNLNEIDLLRLREAARAQGLGPKDINQVQVDIKLQTENDYKHKATLDFVNTGLNASTGTMELRAVLDNKDNIFVPGLFVQVRIAITKPSKQLTIPDTAILYDQIGPYLLLVDQDNKVALTRVELGSINQGMRTILKGLNAKDRVIVNGLQNASPGNKVDVQNQNKQ